MKRPSVGVVAKAVALFFLAAGIGADPKPGLSRPGIQVPSTERQALESVLAALPERAGTAIGRDRLVSLSLAVVWDGQTIFCRAFGSSDLKKGMAAAPETIYPIASVTKLFTAMMLAQLVEAGRVGLEDPVDRYLPEFRPRSPFTWAAPTTLRQLAAHTSGLPQDAPANFWCDLTGFLWLVTQGQTPMTWFVAKDTLLAGLDEVELVYPPDVEAHYSNLNMQVLGLALERACGRPFAEYIENRILGPLGMADTGFEMNGERRDRLARGYVFTGPDAPALDAPVYNLGGAVYSGGLFSTAPDLARFLAFALDENPAEKSPVLGPAGLRRMRTPQSVHRPGVKSAYGLGWGIVRIGDHDAVEHNGALLGYSAHMSAVPELGLGIVALSNTKNYLWRPEACKDFARGVLEDLADALRQAGQAGAFSPAAVRFQDYAGRYALPGETAAFSVEVVEGGLRARLDGTDFDEIIEPVAPDEFCFKTDGRRTPMLFFDRSADGRIGGLTFLSHFFRRQAGPEKEPFPLLHS